MIQYTEAGLVTDNPVVAAMFFGKDLGGNTLRDILWSTIGKGPRYIVRYKHGDILSADICIPWSVVREAIAPVEGEGYICDNKAYSEDSPLTVYSCCFNIKESRIYHKRILSIVTTRTELRKLVEWSRGSR